MMSTRIDSMMGALSETQQRPIRRHRGYIQKHLWTIHTIPLDDLRKMKRDCGNARTAALLDCSEEQLERRLIGGEQHEAIKAARKIPKREGRAEAIAKAMEPAKPAGKVIDLMAALKESLAKEAASAPAALIPDDLRKTVRLDSLAPGDKVRTPHSRDGIAGTEATVVRIGIGSVSVRLGGTRRSMTVREPGMEQESKTIEFDAPGRLVGWAPATMVIKIEG